MCPKLTWISCSQINCFLCNDYLDENVIVTRSIYCRCGNTPFLLPFLPSSLPSAPHQVLNTVPSSATTPRTGVFGQPPSQEGSIQVYELVSLPHILLSPDLTWHIPQWHMICASLFSSCVEFLSMFPEQGATPVWCSHVYRQLYTLWYNAWAIYSSWKFRG